MSDQQWVGSTSEEQILFGALRAGNMDAYWALLAGTYVLVPSALGDADALLAGDLDGDVGLLTVGDDRAAELDVYTRGSIPAQLPRDGFFDQNMFAPLLTWLAEDEPRWTLVVNRGTPVEARASLRDVGRWLRKHPEAVVDWQTLRARHDVRALAGSPLHGALAVGLACGAHLSVMNAVPWNAPGIPYLNYLSDRQTMRDWWDIEDVQEWHATLADLLDRESMSTLDLVLWLRVQSAQQVGPAVAALNPGIVTQAIDEFARSRGLPQEAYQDLMSKANWVAEFEGWMRRDGVLPPDGMVSTQAAWDLGRATNLVRWGTAGGFCAPQQAEQLLKEIATQAAAAYGTWKEYDAAYVLGRLILMGLQGDPEQVYQESLSVHRVLTGDGRSPMVNLALR